MDTDDAYRKIPLNKRDGCMDTDDAYRKITLNKLCTVLEVQFL